MGVTANSLDHALRFIQRNVGLCDECKGKIHQSLQPADAFLLPVVPIQRIPPAAAWPSLLLLLYPYVHSSALACISFSSI